jgi:hypothetical protein
MTTTEIKPGDAVWVVWSPIGGNWLMARQIVKDVCTGDGRIYLPEHGDNCYVRWDRRGKWVKHDKVFTAEAAARAALSRSLRNEAAVLLKQADELDCEADACPDAHTCRHGISN